MVLVEASGYNQPRIGETLTSLARRVLLHLGVWDAFERQGHREVYGSVAAWGAPERYENDFIYSTHGAGWHLDRTRFDAMLAEQAAGQGVRLLCDTRVERTEEDDACWRVHLSGETAWRTRFVVDATGRRAVVARRRDTRFVSLDHLAGFAQFFTEKQEHDPRTLVEAFADGWWYTAGLPEGRRVVVCMTDTDIARRLRLKEPPRWMRLLETMTYIRETTRDAEPCGPLMIRATESRHLAPVSGQGWLAVGDAASIFDPLSSQGIVKALRSGVFASYAIADVLLNDDDLGLRRYRRYVQDEFESYAKIRTQYYAEERRWPESEFWQRRWNAQVETDY